MKKKLQLTALLLVMCALGYSAMAENPNPPSEHRVSIGRMVTNLPMASSAPDLAQTVTGKITDEAGEALIGASIQLKGSSNGTITDTDGNINLPYRTGMGH